MNVSGKTTVFNDILSSCDNIEDFKEDIFRNLDSQKNMWKKKINEIISDNGYSVTKMAQLCEVSKATILKWQKGSIPQNREVFIRIGFAAGYDLDEMNFFLIRYGRYPELYSKNLEDSIYIFVLNSKTIEHTYAACKMVMEKVDLMMYKKVQINSAGEETKWMTEQLLRVEDIEELKGFFEKNKSNYESAYAKFYDFVIEYVRKNNESYIDYDNPDNINQLADILEWSSSLRKCVYLIYKKEWFPIRSKMIALGIHLNMNLDEINYMLQLAKMEQLYVINPMEAVLIYALIAAELEEHIFYGTDEMYCYVIDIMHEVGIEDAEYELV